MNGKWNNKEYVLEAVKENGYALEYASKELQSDKEIVLEAVKQAGGALQFASEELRGDKEVALEALKHSCIAYGLVSEELRNDHDIDVANRFTCFNTPPNREIEFKQKCEILRLDYETTKKYREENKIGDEEAIIHFRPDLTINMFGNLINEEGIAQY